MGWSADEVKWCHKSEEGPCKIYSFVFVLAETRIKSDTFGGHRGVLGSIIEHGGTTLISDRCHGWCVSLWLIGSCVIWVLVYWLAGFQSLSSLSQTFDSPVGRTDWKGSEEGTEWTAWSIDDLMYVSGHSKPQQTCQDHHHTLHCRLIQMIKWIACF